MCVCACSCPASATRRRSGQQGWVDFRLAGCHDDRAIGNEHPAVVSRSTNGCEAIRCRTGVRIIYHEVCAVGDELICGS